MQVGRAQCELQREADELESRVSDASSLAHPALLPRPPHRDQTVATRRRQNEHAKLVAEQMFASQADEVRERDVGELSCSACI